MCNDVSRNEEETMKHWNTLKEYAAITGGTAIVAIAVYFFMLPSHVSVGSVSALAMVLSNFIALPISVISLALNILLMVLGFFLVDTDFGFKTVYGTILLPVLLGVLEVLFPGFQSITQDPLLDVVCYILIVSVGLSVLFFYNASSGGIDTVAMILHKYLKIELGKAMSFSGMAVALSSALCYDARTVVLSVLGTYFGGMVLDHFIFGLNIKRRVCIISEHLEQITDYVLHDLHSGATLSEIIGAYSGTTRKELVVIVDKQEYRLLMDYVRHTDPKAFVTVYAVSEMRYLPKK